MSLDLVVAQAAALCLWCFMSFLGEDSSSDVESNGSLSINEHYAKAFRYKKEREELSKCEIRLLMPLRQMYICHSQ